ncbi:MAG: hypothetical protein ABI239_14480 [Aquihabitans sp.]
MIPRAGVVPERTNERGVVLVMTSLAMVALLVIVALVIDLGYTRGGAGFRQSNADLAALAGGNNLVKGNYRKACEDVVSYVNINADIQPAINPVTFCQTIPASCINSSTPQTVRSTTSGRYDLTVKFPVPDAQIADPTFGAGKVDGTPCERMQVSLTSREPSFFGGIVGRSGYSVTRTATVRGGPSQAKVVPALWLLDPFGCPAMVIGGGAKVTAGSESPPIPGVVAVDSKGTASECSSSKTTIATNGSDSWLRAVPATGPISQQGRVSLFALPAGDSGCSGTACRLGDNILPLPTGTPDRATRAPVDWKWNCKPSYPAYMTIPIPGCPLTGDRDPYIDNLKAKVNAGLSTDFIKFKCDPGDYPAGTVPGYPADTVPPGNYHVDCGSNWIVKGNYKFLGGNVVIDGNVKVNSGNSLHFNWDNSIALGCLPATAIAELCSSKKASFVYQRTGNLNLGGGEFTADKTFVYLGNNSNLDIGAGTKPRWTAPTEGPFAGLALWAEKSATTFVVNGGAGVDLQGTFFTPNATFKLNGNGDWAQAQNAQFISYRLEISGGGELTLAPDQVNSVSLPPPAATLIR